MDKTKNRFSCKRCGYCCKNFGTSNTLPVFSFEIPELEKQAKDQKISLVFVPENILLDKKSGKLFCLNYGMFAIGCPFLLKDKQGISGCSIYKSRPLICKKFPLEKNPLFHEIKKESFFDCENLDMNKILQSIKKENKCLNNKQIEKHFVEIFGKETWKASLEIDKIKTKINKKLKELEKLGIIEICNIDWVDIKKYRVIDVFEFLKEKTKQAKTKIV